MMPGKRASDQFTDYQLTSPANPPDGFPKVFGQTTAWIPGSVELKLTGEPQRWQLVTDLPYHIDRHRSTGVAQGKYEIDSATRSKASGWSGGITRYLGSGQVKWVPAEPSESATYKFFLEISQEDASAIRAFEMEHVDDINYAWDCSFGVVDRVLAQLSRADSAQGPGQLVGPLISGDARYLIPAHPLDPGAWCARVKQVYQLLCDHSAKRDARVEHSPVQRLLKVTGKEITMQVTMGPLHPGSAEYVKPEEIPLVFTATSLEEYVQNQESARPEAGAGVPTPAGGLPPVNTGVEWAVNTAQLREVAPAGLESDEGSIYKQPAIGSNSTADFSWIISTLRYSGGTVVAHDDPYVWVKLTLLEDPDPEEPDQPRARTDTGAYLDADEGFVRLRGSLLKARS